MKLFIKNMVSIRCKVIVKAVLENPAFVISDKIERAKEMLAYNELTLFNISLKLRYSSVSHLSNQFKKIIGLSPSYFKKMKHKQLIALDNI